MSNNDVQPFLRISELYLRITERHRNDENIEAVAPLFYARLYDARNWRTGLRKTRQH